MKKIKRTLYLAIAAATIINSILPFLNASAISGTLGNAYTAGGPIMSPPPGYIYEEGLSAHEVLSRWRTMAEIQAITYYSILVLDDVDEGEYTYDDWVTLKSGEDDGDTDGDGVEGVFRKGTSNDIILSGYFVEKALTGSAEDGRFKQKNAHLLMTNLAKALDVRQVYKDKYPENSDDADPVYRLLCGEEVYNPSMDAFVHMPGLVRDPQSGACTTSSQRLEMVGKEEDNDSEMESILLDRFTYLSAEFHWAINGKYTVHDPDSVNSLGYFDPIAGYGMYLAETGLSEYSLVQDGCISGTNATEGVEKDVWLFDEEANNGKLTKHKVYVYDAGPGGIPSTNYTSFVRKIVTNGRQYRDRIPPREGLKGWFVDNLGWIIDDSINDREVTGQITCSVLIDRMNEIVESGIVDEFYKYLKNDMCYKSFDEQRAAAQAELDDPNTSDERKEYDKAVIKEWDELYRTKHYKAWYEEGQPYDWITGADADGNEITNMYGWSANGYRCIDTEYLQAPDEFVQDPNYTTVTSLSTDESCYTSGGALTWIVCPLISTISGAIEGLYTKFIEPNLVFDASYLLYIGDPNHCTNEDGPEDDEAYQQCLQHKIDKANYRNSQDPELRDGYYVATYTADPFILLRRFWSYFRMIANVLIIILFLVVIASQITGLGINNYGIKKLLPKIIAVSILVNLSYWICLIAIDVANISGGLVKSLLQMLDKQIYIGNGDGAGMSLVFGFVLIAVVTAVVAGSIVSQGWYILIPILAALLTAAIGVIALFAVLALRIVIIWSCVALSGIAIASYILPNTKKFYDLWFSFFWKALLCYPICSAVVYGGQIMAKLVIAITGAGPVSLIMAIFLCVGPLVALPTIIKNSFAAARGAVAALDRHKMRLQGQTNQALRNNRNAREYLMNRQEQLAKNRIKRKAGYVYNAQTGQYENKYGLRGRRAQQILDDPNASAADKAAAQKYLNSVDKKRASYREKAEGIIAREGAQEQYYGDSGLQRVNQLHGASRMKVAQQHAANNFNNGDYETLGEELRNMLIHGRVDGDTLLKQINADDGASAFKAAGLMTQMGSTSKGRERLAEILREATSTGNTDDETKQAIRRVFSSALAANPDFIKNIGIEGEDVIMAQFLEDSYHGKQSAQGSFDEWGDALAEVVHDQNGNIDMSRSKTNRQLASERALKKPSVLIGQGDSAISDITQSGLLSQEKYRTNLRNTILRGDWSEKGGQLTEMIDAYADNATGEELVSLIQTGKLSSSDQSRAISKLVAKPELPATEISRLLSDRDFKTTEEDITALTDAMNRHAETASITQLSNALLHGTYTTPQTQSIQRRYQAAIASKATTATEQQTIGEAYLRRQGGTMPTDENGNPYADATSMIQGFQARAQSTNDADAQAARTMLQQIGQAYVEQLRGGNA